MRAIAAHVAQAAAQGQIVYQQCPACGHAQAQARPFCHACLRPDPDWRLAAGGGLVVALTVQHRAPTEDWQARVPYAIALVDLDEGPRVMALASDDVSTGDRVVLRPGGLHALPCFDRQA